MRVHAQAELLWRAITYLSVAQVHLTDNVLLRKPLTAGHVKTRPSGHWGTVPGTAMALCHTILTDAPARLCPVIGPGHAGVVQASLAWLTGTIREQHPEFTRDLAGLRELVRSFPHLAGLGSEVSPALPYGLYTGGQLGPALAFAHGLALADTGSIAVPIIGDGECETPVAAASWLASRAFTQHCAVMPVVHLNGQRMGGPSLLSTCTQPELEAYFRGLGWTPRTVRVDHGNPGEHEEFAAALQACAAGAATGERHVLILRCPKGFGGPLSPLCHKSPLLDPAGDPGELSALATWLASYRPDELFTQNAEPAPALSAVLARIPPWPKRQQPCPGPVAPRGYGGGFSAGVTAVVDRHAASGGFRLFSPDELASNRLAELATRPFTTELLAEEVCLAALLGWLASGRRGLLISYEAFAPLMTTAIVQHLKARRAGWRGPSLNLLLTSYGWHNTYTHGDPSLATVILATRDPAVHVITPADATRTAAALDAALGSDQRVNIIIAGKHPAPVFPAATITAELSRGLATWPGLSDDGEPDLVLAGAGDLPAAAFTSAIPRLRRELGLQVRYVHIHDLTVLGDPSIWPGGLNDDDQDRYFGRAPLLIGTLGHPAAIWGLLGGRQSRPVEVLGWAEAPGPATQAELLTMAGLDQDGILAAAKTLLARNAA